MSDAALTPAADAAEAPWLAALRAAVKAHGQPAIAQRIDYSVAVVSQTLNGTYAGNTARVQQAVEGALMGAVVDCPVVGELPRQRCVQYQRQAYAATNPLRVQLSHACPKCPNRTQQP